MDPQSHPPEGRPSAQQILLAVEIYFRLAYGPDLPALKCSPPEGLGADDKGPEVDRWLMSDAVDRDPPGAPLEEVRTFSLRLGNRRYPHMKLKISRPSQEPFYVFCVDSHDTFLRAIGSAADHEALEELKAYNNALAHDIRNGWQQANLPTEESYLRHKLAQARKGTR